MSGLSEIWSELEVWERRLLPPDRMNGPKLGFCRSDDGKQYIATHWSPLYQDILWTAQGSDRDTLMKVFRTHLEAVAGSRKEAA